MSHLSYVAGAASSAEAPFQLALLLGSPQTPAAPLLLPSLKNSHLLVLGSRLSK